MFVDFNEMPAHSRVWIYQSDRLLSGDEAANCIENAEKFLTQWAAHGQSLRSSAKLFYNRFLVIVVDEQAANASGCSIDASVHFVQALGQNLGIDFFNRQLITWLDNGEVKHILLQDLAEQISSGTIHEDTEVFNNLVSDKASFEQQWICRAADTWMKRYFKKQETHQA